jgi:hypothetical protein
MPLVNLPAQLVASGELQLLAGEASYIRRVQTD